MIHDLSILLDQIYKSESLAEVSRDNSLKDTYDDQGFGINTTHLKILHALKVQPDMTRT